MELSEAVEEIDIILGGHSHNSWVQRHLKFGTTVVHSGSEFRELAIIDVGIGENTISTEIEKVSNNVGEKVRKFSEAVIFDLIFNAIFFKN